MKKFIICYLLFIYIIDAEALRSIKKDISPPSNIQYIIENYIENGDRSTEIGIAIHKDNFDSEIKLPTVVFIHGGGWRSGDKQQNAWQCFNYADKGFVAITISYRLLDEAPFPPGFPHPLLGQFPLFDPPAAPEADPADVLE